MKTTTDWSAKTYQCITVSFECWTESDAAKLHAIFNYTDIFETLELQNTATIVREAIREAGCSQKLMDKYYHKLEDTLEG